MQGSALTPIRTPPALINFFLTTTPTILASLIEQWEQGRRKPDKSSETYLRLIEQAPDTVADLVARL